MHYVTANQLSKSYGVRPLFNNIDFHVSEGDKIAIVASNGSGKSTLLKILSGLETPDSGTVWVNKDVKVVFLHQDHNLNEQLSIIDNILAIDHPLVQLLKAYEMALEKEDHDLVNQLIPQMNDKEAWLIEGKIKETLGKLKITDLSQLVKNLSGGQKRRIALAKTLLEIDFQHTRTLLLLDEPTNHLDIDMIEWLENYLSKERVTLLTVTHDRYFLENVCDTIWELEKDKIYAYKGDYAYFLEKKAERIEQNLATIDKAKNSYRRELEWMRKQPKARTTKSKSREQNFYEIEKIAKQNTNEAKLMLQAKMSRLGGKIIELKKVYKSYGDKIILQGFDYTFNKGERLGIVGANGAGKSTFLKILTGDVEVDSGKRNLGETVVFGHFSQDGLDFKEDKRVIEFVKDIAENFPLADGSYLSASQFLELFLFTPEKQYTYLSKLSGGEKKRLQLLSILFKNPNFLILDEPTNDLDLETLSVLESFLLEYKGCVLIVSHDRYFMDRLVDHLMVFEGAGKIKDFAGNYTQYRDEVLSKVKSEEKKSAPVITNTPASPKPSKGKLSYKEQKELEEIDLGLVNLENEKNEISALLSSGTLSYDLIKEKGERLQAIEAELERMEMRWLELNEKLENN